MWYAVALVIYNSHYYVLSHVQVLSLAHGSSSVTPVGGRRHLMMTPVGGRDRSYQVLSLGRTE